MNIAATATTRAIIDRVTCKGVELGSWPGNQSPEDPDAACLSIAFRPEQDVTVKIWYEAANENFDRRRN